MRLVLLAFALGCALMQVQASLPSPAWLVAITAVTGGLAWLGARHAACAIMTGALAGFVWAAAFAHVQLADELPAEWEGRDIELVGVIASLPQHFERGVRFEFTPEAILTAGAVTPDRLQLAWYGGFARDDAQAVPAVSAGQRWRLVVRLKRPHGSANPHGFDYEAWLLERGLRATGYVRPPRAESAPRLIKAFVWRPATAVDRLREHIRERLQNALEGSRYGGVIVALAVGDQRAIDSDDWQTFTRTGVGHLMSISGLHVTMIASLGGLLAWGLWRRSTRLMLWVAAPRAAALAGFVAALAYCLLAGFAIPAQRTLFMIAVAAWALWRGWHGSGARILAIALALVSLIDPWAALSPGFWLSFGAVAMLLLAGNAGAQRMHWFKAALVAQFAVTVGLIPLTLMLFQQVSVIGPLANAVAIPVVSFIVTPLALLASAIPLDALALAAHGVLAVLMTWLEWLSALDGAIWQRAAPPLWAVLLAVTGAIWCLIPWSPHWRMLGAIWILPVLLHPVAHPDDGDVWVTVLDVGQGLAVVARTRERVLLFDTGPQYTPESDGGNRVIVPYLRGEGVAALDGMIISHDDLDHSGGALSMHKAMPTGWLASPLPDTHPASAAASTRRRCADGQGWEWNGVKFDFLSPAPSDYERLDALKDNSRSCVLRIEAHGKRVLLPADIERDVEERLVERDSARLKSDVLVVPHHGSKTSSTPAFIAATAPVIAILPVGYRNRFRHPAEDVVARYRAAGIRLLRTDLDGAVTVRVSATGIVVETWRDKRRRYWHGR